MGVRTVRFVLLLLTVVVAFGATASRARAAAEVSNEPMEKAQQGAITEAHKEVVEHHESTTVEEHTQKSVVIGDTKNDSQPPAQLDSGNLAEVSTTPAAARGQVTTTPAAAGLVRDDPSAVKMPVYTATIRHTQLTAQQGDIALTAPAALTTNTPVPSTPQLPVTSNPLMILFGMAYVGSQVASQGWSLLEIFVALPTSTSVPEVIGLSLATILLMVGVGISLLRKTRYQHAARADLADAAALLYFQYLSMQPGLFKNQGSVFSCFGNKKIIQQTNEGGLV